MTEKESTTYNRGFDLCYLRDIAQAELTEEINFCPENYDRLERDPDVIGRKSREFAAMFGACWDFAMKQHMMMNSQSAR